MEALLFWGSITFTASGIICNSNTLRLKLVKALDPAFAGYNTNSKHERIVVPGLLPCSFVGCSVSVALLRFPCLLLAASQNPSTLWMHSCFTLV
jgi:hypothetical protein